MIDMNYKDSTTKITVRVDEKIEDDFRDTVGRVYGLRRGKLKQAVEEALILFMTATPEEIEAAKQKYTKEMRKKLPKGEDGNG